MKITKHELAQIVAEETLNYYRFKEGRLIGKGFAKDLVNKMNAIADVVNKFDPSSVGEEVAAELNAAQQALNSALEGTFGDITAGIKHYKPTPSTLGEGCGDMSTEPMPMPGPPPEGFDPETHAMEPSYDDHEGRMAKSQLYKMSKYSEELMQMLGDQDQLPAWVQAKITKAADYLGAVKNHLEYEHASPEAMNEKFNKVVSEEPRGVSDILKAGNDARAHLEMIARDMEKLRKANGRVPAILKAVDNQNFEEAAEAIADYVILALPAVREMMTGIKELDLLSQSLEGQ